MWKSLVLALAAPGVWTLQPTRLPTHVVGYTVAEVDGEPFPLPEATNAWGDFQYVEGTECLDGEETGVWLRRGKDLSRLVMYFQGGGGCFNTITWVTIA